jgi:hypothetical protein
VNNESIDKADPHTHEVLIKARSSPLMWCKVVNGPGYRGPEYAMDRNHEQQAKTLGDGNWPRSNVEQRIRPMDMHDIGAFEETANPLYLNNVDTEFF